MYLISGLYLIFKKKLKRFLKGYVLVNNKKIFINRGFKDFDFFKF